MARTASILRLVRYGGIAATLLGVLPGCVNHCGKCKTGCGKGLHGGLDPAVTPQPLGTFVRGWQEAQTTKAEASDFVFYLDEWYLGGPRLGPHGLAHLRQVIRRLPAVPFPVVLQPHVDEQLNEVRRTHIVEALLNNGITDADRRVVIDIPQAEGLPGDEAERIYYEMTIPNHWGPLGGGYGGYGGSGYGRFGGAYGRAGFLTPWAGAGVWGGIHPGQW